MALVDLAGNFRRIEIIHERERTRETIEDVGRGDLRCGRHLAQSAVHLLKLVEAGADLITHPHWSAESDR